jgi:hypothetical protein
MKLSDQKKIRQILKNSKRIAVVGISEKPDKPSYEVADFLMKNGFEIIPVNPKYDSVLAQKCYPSLLEVPGNVDIVDIFLRPEHILPVVEQAIKIKTKVIWMQLGIINTDAALLAEKAGIDVIMDQCLKIQYQTLIIED